MSMADHTTQPLHIAPDPEILHAYHRQQLSAMLDGELSPDEAKFMLRRLEHDMDLAQCWERWQICGEVLRGRAESLLPSDFAARVAVAVQGSLLCSNTSRSTLSRSRPVFWGGVGLAASLALVMGVLVIFRGDEAVPDAVPIAAIDASMSVSQGMIASTVSSLEPLSATASALSAEVVGAPILSSAPVVREIPVPIVPRPWPRAGGGASAFSVGYGRQAPRSMDLFQPRWMSPPLESSAFWPEPQAYPGPAASRQD